MRSDICRNPDCDFSVRWVGLYDSKLREIHWSGLLVHVTIKPSKRTSYAINQTSPKADRSKTSFVSSAVGSLDFINSTVEERPLSFNGSGGLLTSFLSNLGKSPLTSRNSSRQPRDIDD